MTTEPRTTNPQPVAITTGSLAKALATTIPFADRDDALPAMCVIQLHCADGTLTATATNRYVIGHARQQAIGAFSRRRYLHWREARALRKALTRHMADRSSGRDLVTLTENGTNLTVTFGSGSTTYTEPDGADQAPELGKILAGLPTNDTVGVLQPIGLNRRVIKPVLKAAAWEPYEPMRWLMTEPGTPFRVEIGDWFVAGVMPANLRGGQKNIPVELPGAETAGASR